jgi:D-serine deaminase-like pyridoxal phosphate-dependent protein
MELAAVEGFVESLGDTVLDWSYKGFGSLPAPVTVAEVRHRGQGPQALGLHELGTPMMTVDLSAVADNLLQMSSWCGEHGVQLAPHGKTTMAPLLWLGQLMSGCVGITVANASQLRAARAFGVDHLQLASELVQPADVAWVAAELERHEDFEFICWVDSVEAVERMQTALVGQPGRARVPVCVEVGAAAGRTGARGLDAVLAVAAAVNAADRLALAGVSGYEGAVPGSGPDAAGLAAVDAFLRAMADAHLALTDLYETARVTVTAGGSSFFDRVAAVLGPLAAPEAARPVDVVLRSGAYVVHDDVHYRDRTPSSRGDGPPLRAAIHVWAGVLSRPEPDLVILDAGRRDLPFDLDLPVVLSASRSGSPRVDVPVGRATVVRLNDQHAFVRVGGDCELAVGDVVRLGLSHPCTAFDKWRAIALLDSADVLEPRVEDVVLTFF